MKTNPFVCSICLLISAPPALLAQTTAITTPVGYSYEAAVQGYNLMGIVLHKNEFATGCLKEVAKDHVIAAKNGSKPPAELVPGTTYILEITSGDHRGVVQELTKWSDTRLETTDDLATAGVKPGDGFSIRKAPTLNTLFPPATCGLVEGELPETSDSVLIPHGTAFGDFQQCFLGGGEWLDAASGKPTGDTPLIYPDGLVVDIRSPNPKPFVQFGQLRTGPVSAVLTTGINLVATPSPANTTLQSLGLEKFLAKSDELMEKADKVWLPDPLAPGGHEFNLYAMDSSGTWCDVSSGAKLQGPVAVGTAILIERVGGPLHLTLGQ